MYRSVTDHFRLRLMDTGWAQNVVRFMKDDVIKRIENGQTTLTVKFEELYKDIVDKARGENLIILRPIERRRIFLIVYKNIL